MQRHEFRLPTQDNESRKSFPITSRYLSAMSNELKLVALMYMAFQNKPFKQGELYDELLDLEGEFNPRHKPEGWTPHQNSWVFTKALPFGYCKQSFSRMGFVISTHDAITNQQSYQINEAERAKVLALGNRLYKFSRDHGVALHNLIGTSSGRATGVSTKLNLFQELLRIHNEKGELGTIPIGDMAHVLQVDKSNVAYQAAYLAELDVISYETAKVGEDLGAYTKTDNMLSVDSMLDQMRPRGRRSSFPLTRAVGEILFNAKDGTLFNIRDIYGLLQEQFGYKGSYEHMRTPIYTTLDTLSKYGYVQNTGFSNEVRSKIYLTDEQATLIQEFMALVESFEEGYGDIDIPAEIAQTKQLLIQKDITRQLFAKAHEFSDQPNVLSEARREKNILTSVIQAGVINASDLAKSQHSSSSALESHIKRLMEKGLLTHFKSREQSFYMLTVKHRAEQIDTQGGIVMSTLVNGKPIARILAFGEEAYNKFVKKVIPQGIALTLPRAATRLNEWRSNFPGYPNPVTIFIVRPQKNDKEDLTASGTYGKLKDALDLAVKQEIERIQ